MPASSCVASKPYANPRTYPTAAPTPTPRSDNPVETIAAPTQSEIGRRSNPYITARKKRIYEAVNTANRARASRRAGRAFTRTCARQPCDRLAQSGLVLGFDLFADGARFFVLSGDFGCSEPQSVGLAAVGDAE